MLSGFHRTLDSRLVHCYTSKHLQCLNGADHILYNPIVVIIAILKTDKYYVQNLGYRTILVCRYIPVS